MCDKLPLLTKHKFRYINQVGVELEGSWDMNPDFQVYGDGSVNVQGAVVGESHTEPMDNIQGIFNEVEAKYPDHLDESCGMHVHISLPELYYSCLCDVGFWNHFGIKMGLLGDYIRKSGVNIDYDRFIYRLDGNNSTCRSTFEPNLQVNDRNKSSNRYRQLNFCYSLHKTLECRVLPMFVSVDNAKMAIYHLLWVVESYLSVRTIRREYKAMLFMPDCSSVSTSKKEIICV